MDDLKIILASGIDDQVHRMPEQWLRSRVRGWMELTESPGLGYWCGTYTAEGKWIYCSSDDNTLIPTRYRQEYAMAVCRHVNKACANGGAWLVGWIRNCRVFYLLWKDIDGDIQIPIEADKPFIALQKYSVTDWESHCSTAHHVWKEHHKNLEQTGAQQVKRAQGQRTTPEHLDAAPAIVMP